jgi:hypothetical protein
MRNSPARLRCYALSGGGVRYCISSAAISQPPDMADGLSLLWFPVFVLTFFLCSKDFL